MEVFCLKEKVMALEQELHVFTDLKGFMTKIKHESMKTFLVTFENATEFIEKYNEDEAGGGRG